MAIPQPGPHHGRIIVAGDLGIDIHLDLSGVPRLDEKRTAASGQRSLGGTAANAAAAILRLGGRPLLYGAVGDDPLGVWTLTLLRDAGLDPSHVRVLRGRTMAAVVLSGDGERQIIVDRGVADQVAAEALTADLSADDVVYMSATPLTLVQAVLDAGTGARVIVGLEARQVTRDSAAAWRHGWAGSGLIVTNSAGERALMDAGARWPGESRPPGELIVTQGSAGASYTEASGRRLLVPAVTVEAVDATGAGDCFAGALCFFLTQGETMLDSLRLAVAAASLSTRVLGSQGGLPDQSEVRAVVDRVQPVDMGGRE
ncbi:MAG: carbohydrate kinase family protein [Candidatus Dormiibacterota bacterium]|jgi:sugar/nucleoside kinase (ribokinase family)